MALDFPASPNINDTYTSGGVTWTWDGTTWKVLGRFQFTSSETDPIFSASPASNILSTHITNWDTSYGWGDHSAAGYLTTTGSINSHTDVTIATLQDAQLLKYSAANSAWENWTPNFLTSYTETDPVFGASPAGGITGTNISNWNTAYNWGDHASGGYLTSYTETQTLDDVLTLGATTTRDITTTGKLYYSNNFATTGDLPNATTYHGMFAHVHGTGKGYFSHDNVTSIAVTVGVDSVAGQATGVFYFNGVEKPGSFIIRRGVAYTFDQSDSSNANYGGVHHPLMISATLDGELNGGSHYMTGVTYKLDGAVVNMAGYVSGFVAATTRTVEWTPVANAPDTLYYWCHFHTGQGNSFSIGNGSWVQLLDTNSSLTDLAGVDLSTPPATGEVLKFDGSNWVAAADGGGGGGANVTISDTIPAGSPSAGDLWWESDSGRLKVYYTDVDSSQWVDASPPLADATTIGASGTVSMKAHIIPDTDAAYDLGNAEYKIRHLFLSDNSMWLGNSTRMSVGFRNNNDAQLGARPTVRFYNRNVNQTPRPIAQAGGSVSGCISWVNSTFPGRSGVVNASTLLLTDWTGYWSSLTGAPIGTYGVDDLYPPQFLNGDINPAYFGADWADIMGFGQNGQERAITIDSDSAPYDLAESDTFIRVNATDNFNVNIDSISTDNDTFFNMTIWISQGGSAWAPNTFGFSNGAGGYTGAVSVKYQNAAANSTVQAIKITGIKISGSWHVNVDFN